MEYVLRKRHILLPQFDKARQLHRPNLSKAIPNQSRKVIGKLLKRWKTASCFTFVSWQNKKRYPPSTRDFPLSYGKAGPETAVIPF